METIGVDIFTGITDLLPFIAVNVPISPTKNCFDFFHLRSIGKRAFRFGTGRTSSQFCRPILRISDESFAVRFTVFHPVDGNPVAEKHHILVLGSHISVSIQHCFAGHQTCHHVGVIGSFNVFSGSFCVCHRNETVGEIMGGFVKGDDANFDIYIGLCRQNIAQFLHRSFGFGNIFIFHAAGNVGNQNNIGFGFHVSSREGQGNVPLVGGNALCGFGFGNCPGITIAGIVLAIGENADGGSHYHHH